MSSWRKRRERVIRGLEKIFVRFDTFFQLIFANILFKYFPSFLLCVINIVEILFVFFRFCSIRPEHELASRAWRHIGWEKRITRNLEAAKIVIFFGGLKGFWKPLRSTNPLFQRRNFPRSKKSRFLKYFFRFFFFHLVNWHNLYDSTGTILATRIERATRGCFRCESKNEWKSFRLVFFSFFFFFWKRIPRSLFLTLG